MNQSTETQQKIIEIMSQDELEDKIAEFFVERHAQGQNIKSKDGTTTKRRFYTKESVRLGSSNWCHYCLSKEITCNVHQVELTKEELKQLLNCIKLGTYHKLL
jgi:hypothetical protein